MAAGLAAYPEKRSLGDRRKGKAVTRPPEALRIDTAADGRIRLIGDLDISTAPLLHAALAPALAERPPRLVLDVSELDFCDSAGLTALVQTRKTLPDTSQLVLHGSRPRIRRLLRITNLDTTFTLT